MYGRDFRKGFWQLADPKIWVASTVPMAVAVALAATAAPAAFHLGWCLLAFAGVYLIEIGKNAVNEYVDFSTGVDLGVDAAHRTPFSGGKKTIVDGLLSQGQTAWIALGAFGAAALIGLTVVFFREFNVLYVGLAGFGLALLYSLPPFRLSYRGLGEVTVGVTFGPLVLCGMYLMLTHRLDALPMVASLPLGALITNVLWINQFPDYEADKAGNKRNWVVRMGKRRAVFWYGALFALAYLGFAATALVAGNAIWLLGLLSAPIAWRAVDNARRHHQDIPRLIASNGATVQVYLCSAVAMIVAAVVDSLMC